ncbi:MAG: hypothetical protein NC405_00510 [Odoribacter sp.]|nr:hypothetical protein [Odoribacter sp.]
MKYALILPLCISACFTTSAATMETVADTTLALPAETITYHLRVKPPSRGTSVAEIRWQHPDSAGYHFARFEYNGSGARETWDNSVDLTTGYKHNDREVINTNNVRVPDDPVTSGISLKLDFARRSGAVIMVGCTRAAATVEVPFCGETDTHITVQISGIRNVQLNRLDITDGNIPQWCRFESVEDLAAYLDTSENATEGFWQYYDRHTDPQRASIGGYYSLATIANGTGGYDIIYLGGSDDNRWQPLRIKGRLTRAVFPGLYDLQWFDPDGIAIPSQNDAVMTESLLTLNFPYWKASMRFSRVKP